MILSKYFSLLFFFFSLVSCQSQVNSFNSYFPETYVGLSDGAKISFLENGSYYYGGVEKRFSYTDCSDDDFLCISSVVLDFSIPKSIDGKTSWENKGVRYKLLYADNDQMIVTSALTCSLIEARKSFIKEELDQLRRELKLSEGVYKESKTEALYQYIKSVGDQVSYLEYNLKTPACNDAKLNWRGTLYVYSKQKGLIFITHNYSVRSDPSGIQKGLRFYAADGKI